jgi:membrane protein
VRRQAPRAQAVAVEIPAASAWRPRFTRPIGEVPAVRFAVAVVRRFVEHGMTVYAAALAYRGLVALVPFVLVVLGVFDWLGVGDPHPLPRLPAGLLQFSGTGGDGPAMVSGGELLSAGAVVGIWSMATGARLLMRALNTAHQVKEERPLVRHFTFSLVFLPAVAAVTAVATVLLLLTSRVVDGIGGVLGMAPVLAFLGSWLRFPAALALLGLAVGTVYRFGPSVHPPYRAVAAGATVTVVLWAAASAGFAWAVSTVLDHGSTYGSLGAAVALLVYLHLSALVLMLGAEVSAEFQRCADGGGSLRSADS